jgi:hypothetical protein
MSESSSAPSKGPATPVTFAGDIAKLFTPLDIQKMKWKFDLSKYADVKANAANIQNRIQGIGGDVMPPPPPRGDGPWSQARIDLFKAWVQQGCQP